MRILVTGGAGFIGSNFIRKLLSNDLCEYEEITILDKLTYAGSLTNLNSSLKRKNVKFIEGDICDTKLIEKLFSLVDTVVNFAAESHVDRSINSSSEFIRTNVEGTRVLLDFLRIKPEIKFLHVSTDEVYGSINEGSWTESSPLMPNSPYSASKAASDLLALSYFKTYGLDIRISRCCNNYGPNQFPEKVIPLFITNLMREMKVPLYGTGSNVREWIHVDDHCNALNLILKSGKPGHIYNIGSGHEISNLELTAMLLGIFKKSTEEIEYVADRLGHDIRYSLDSSKIERELGFKPRKPFEVGLLETIDWYRKNEAWWRTKTTG